MSADQLVAAVPGLAETGITVEVEDFRRVSGASLSFEDITALAAEIPLENQRPAQYVFEKQVKTFVDKMHSGPVEAPRRAS